ncbi:MAG: peptidylprolyl isomerase [Acidimicrobiales bacterium]|nr:peptidylprolyl isomerase [Hyphomonadaceae bacterium]RZV41990.1 MAG: peptidylprolyl isomerase [Acidimicrobiales bacterium]
MSFSKLLLVSACALGSALLPSIAQAQNSHGIAAVVNDDIVTTYDLQQRARFMMATTGVEPDEAAQRRILQQAMRNLVDEKLQIQEAKKYDQTISDDSVARGVQNLISRNGIDVNEFAQRLASAGINIATLQEQVRAEIAWQRIIGGLYGSRIRISDAQIDETINRLSANANKPSYNVTEIYIEATPDIGGMEGAMQGAEAMIAQLQQGAPFDVLARQFSSSATAAKGGEVGWVREGELREELNSVITQMDTGAVAPPIPVPGGVYVIGLVDKRVSTSETFYKLSSLNYATSDETDLPTARTAIKNARDAAKSCDSLEDDVANIEGLKANPMGEIKSSDLTDDILTILSNTNVGEISEPLETPNGLVSLMVCERDIRGSNIPSREQVEDRLLSQQEAQASRRHLRNLRRNATIVTR